MGNTLSTKNLNAKPWTSFEAIESALSTGDIVIFSTRSFSGRAIRYHTTAFWSHCGIIIKPDFCAGTTLVMEPCVERESLWTCKNTGKLMVGSHVQSLRSKIYSHGYDLAAVRKVVWTSKTSRDAFFQGLSIINETNAEFATFDLGYNLSDPLAQRLIEFSQLRNEFTINQEKFEKFLKPTFFDSKYIFGATDEDLSMLVSGEYLAEICYRMQLFENTEKVKSSIPKFKAKHFCSGSAFLLPWNKKIVKRLTKERFLYMDYQVFDEDLILRQAPRLDFKFPKYEST